MENQARIMLKVLDRLEVGSFHLCAHSMGGLVAMSMAEQEPSRVLSLIDLEGNLTPEDCFISGRIARFSFEEFTQSGRRNLEKDFREAGLENPAMIEYAETFGMASTAALYKSADQTVAESSTPLVERLSKIKNVCFIYGDKNKGKYPGENLLLAAGIPLFYIQGAGHSMATENPKQLYRVIRSFIDDLPRNLLGG